MFRKCSGEGNLQRGKLVHDEIEPDSGTLQHSEMAMQSSADVAHAKFDKVGYACFNNIVNAQVRGTEQTRKRHYASEYDTHDLDTGSIPPEEFAAIQQGDGQTQVAATAAAPHHTHQ